MDIELEALGRALKQAQYRQHRAADLALGDIGTTLVQWDALRAIASAPGASAHDLAMATFQTDQSFGTLANRLAAQDLIDRRSGEGRRIEHRLTVKGEKLLAAANIITDRVRGELYAPLSQDHRHTLAQILTRLLDDEAPASPANKKGRPKATL
jgi:DNA-binding MarR family transcriptional regulator